MISIGVLTVKGSKCPWDYLQCYGVALSCSKKRDMKDRSSLAMKTARDNGWLKDYTWFQSTEELNKRPRPNRVKWPYTVVESIAKKYTTLSQFTKENKLAAAVARKQGWLDTFSWLKRSLNPYIVNNDTVYAYLFFDTKTVYIGRTIHPHERDFDHRNDEKSAVFRYAHKFNKDIPAMTLLSTGLSIETGLIKEDFYVKEFKRLGWFVLNKAKTGLKSGSVGLLRENKWTEKTCYAEAQKYKRYIDFERNSATAYNKAVKNKWVKQYTWLQRRVSLPRHISNRKKFVYTYELCESSAKRCNTLSKFKWKYPGAYKAALTNGWINEFTWLAQTHEFRWTEDLCFLEAKKYVKYREFVVHSPSAYNAAREHGWLNQYTWLTKKDISKKTVLQLSLDGCLIAKHNGAREAARSCGLTTASGIITCCNGKLRQCHGYIWKYEV